MRYVPIDRGVGGRGYRKGLYQLAAILWGILAACSVAAWVLS